MTFTRRNAERLLTLAYFLRTQVDLKYFDMTSFISSPHSGRNELEELKDARSLITAEPRCGTTACAAGWCPATFPDDWYWAEDCGGASPFLYDENIMEVNTWDCLEKFFGINGNESDELFGAEHKRTPKQEAAVIEKFVESKGYVYADSPQ